jgi:putative ABC transport system permease protein
MLMRLAVKSLLQRKLAVALIVLAMSLSLATLLLTRSLSSELRSSFSNSISGTDLIVAARSHPLQVLLYSVFRMGTPTQAMSAERWHEIGQQPQTAWTFPIVLGDSHQGYAVIGTNDDYFRHFRYGRQQALQLSSALPAINLQQPHFAAPLQVFIGATVARERGYQTGDHLHLSHGSHGHSFMQHKEVDFVVAGILQPTGTPVDRSLHVHLQTLEALHDLQQAGRLATAGWQDLPEADAISALFVGLTSRPLLFQLQNVLNQPHQEPLTAVIPGVALSEFWQLLGNAEQLLQALSLLMLITSLLGSVAMLQVTVAGRRQEIALLRIIGARPLYLFVLLETEVLLLTLLSWLLALSMAAATQWLAQPLLAEHYGLLIEPLLNLQDVWLYAALSLGLALLAGLLPALSAYRLSLTTQH